MFAVKYTQRGLLQSVVEKTTTPAYPGRDDLGPRLLLYYASIARVAAKIAFCANPPCDPRLRQVISPPPRRLGCAPMQGVGQWRVALHLNWFDDFKRRRKCRPMAQSQPPPGSGPGPVPLPIAPSPMPPSMKTFDEAAGTTQPVNCSEGFNRLNFPSATKTRYEQAECPPSRI
jgi:hypothetical protein